MSQHMTQAPKTRSAEKTDEPSQAEWLERLENVHIQRADLNRLIMNYLVTEGFKEAAEKFRLESGAPCSVDLDSLDERIRIRDHIQQGRMLEAIALLNNLRPELLDNDRYLLFHLQQQHLIELIRDQKIEEVLAYAQEHLSERGEENPDVLCELERTLALLAFDEPQSSPFGDLLHPSHRQKVASEVNAALLDDEQRPQLTVLLCLLLWAQEQLDSRKVRYPKVTDLAEPFK
ncbi:glucose-induced degradation protein 8 homolog [Ornithodoros turicata]|uniref:Putative lish motif-containing protein n=1 Tax=Ornithodoros turicata TaxID=34597 RepID=A0A2R5LJ04_9ACAR